ncbi:uncharacterized protein LOC126551911 [Aphis gossypii]|uniref:uncharacterized protein LOC126551911 n=1 Tax=Aphis gossypii TaxID=80765 RepID=UPI002158EEC6|nr:uncharacterized protein LOC126551911 [Aphis gossypii]
MSLIPENDPIIMYQPHNHGPGHDIEIGYFLATLRLRASNEGIPARAIYEDVSRRYPNAAIEVSREHALRAIRHVQRRFSPQVPNTLRAMRETIMSLRWHGRLLNVLDDINNVPFYQGNLEYLDNNAVVFGGLIFANVAFLQHYAPYFRQARVVAVDGTFSVFPRYPADMEQFVTIHVILDNISVPVLYAILNRRTENVCIRLWQFLRRDLPFDIFDWENLQIITDFETAMRNEVRRIVPECRLIGCWFHFSQVCI